MKNHWIQEKKRYQSTKYSVQLFCLDHFGNIHYLCVMPLSNNMRWTATYDTDINGFHVRNEQHRLVHKEEFVSTFSLSKGDDIRLSNYAVKLQLQLP